MSELFRRLDRMPFRLTLAAGVALGLAATLATVYLPGGLGLAAAAVVIALAGGLAWSGQPVGIFEEVALEGEEFLDMVAIEGGSFLMGSPWREAGRFRNERRHRVRISPFRMSMTTVTRAEYREVMDLQEAPGSGGDQHPVTEVSWFDAVQFCNRLSEREGLEPCYETEGDQVSWIEDAGGYRLPTEAEWEYAARAGTTGRWSFGDDEKQLGEYAWYAGNSGRKAHPVKTREPNPWGLYDVHGNVWEWCWDAWGAYGYGSAKDPRDPSDSSIVRKLLRGPRSRRAPSAGRVLRGGAFWLGPRNLRSAFRDGAGPGGRYGLVGFRCVRRPRRQP